MYEELLDVAAATGAPRAAVAALLTDTGSGSGMTQSLKWAVKFHRVRPCSMLKGAVLLRPFYSLPGRGWHRAALRTPEKLLSCSDTGLFLPCRHQPPARRATSRFQSLINPGSVHVTPTVFVNGLEAGVVSSGWSAAEWQKFLQPMGADNWQGTQL